MGMFAPKFERSFRHRDSSSTSTSFQIHLPSKSRYASNRTDDDGSPRPQSVRGARTDIASTTTYAQISCRMGIKFLRRANSPVVRPR